MRPAPSRGAEVDEGDKARRATERGEQLRSELVECLRAGPQAAEELQPQLKIPDVSLSEVIFQLEHMTRVALTAIGDLIRSF